MYEAEPNTVCHADDLVGWRDFPKGLRVLIVEGRSSSADIKSKLEQMDFIGIQKKNFIVSFSYLSTPIESLCYFYMGFFTVGGGAGEVQVLAGLS